jgi:hypothetical protein
VAAGRGGLHGVAAVGVAGPADRRLVAAPRVDPDLVGDEEAGQQPDAELAEELVAGEAQLVAL